MKKYLFIFLFSLAIVPTFSQNLRLSLHADPMMTWLSPQGSRIENDGVRMGFQFGLAMDRFFQDNYAFNTGIYLGYAGGNIVYSDTVTLELSGNDVNVPGGNRVTYRLQYLSVPLGLTLRTNEIGYSTFYANLGLLPMTNIKTSADISSLDYSRENANKEINWFNLGYFIGAGLHYSLGGETSLIAGLQFTNGFIDQAKSSQHKFVMNSVMLRLGVLF